MTANGGPSAPWLIGGPPRNGKTTLVNALQGSSGDVAGLPVEGLFPVYLNRRFLFPRGQCRGVVRDYLERPRFTDVERSQSARPIDFYTTPIDRVIEEAPGDYSEVWQHCGRSVLDSAVGVTFRLLRVAFSRQQIDCMMLLDSPCP